MRALEFAADGAARVVERPVPEPGPGDVRVRITSAGICGSDVTALRGDHPFRRPPLITGHEGGGVVDAVGHGVDAQWVGRAVALEPQRACGRCAACVADLPHLCRHRLMLGMADWPGTLAEYVTVPTSCLHAVDAAVPDGLLALAEPLAVAEHAYRMVGELGGRSVAVLGGGSIGALLVHLAAEGGAARVAAADPRPHCRAVCAGLGAGVVADPTTAEGRDELAAAGPFDLVAVAVAAAGVLDQAVSLLRPRGTVLQVGMFTAPVTLDVAALQQDEKTLVGSNVYRSADFAAAARALERTWSRLAALTTDGGGLDGAATHLRDAVAGRAPDDVIKLLVRPGRAG